MLKPFKDVEEGNRIAFTQLGRQKLVHFSTLLGSHTISKPPIIRQKLDGQNFLIFSDHLTFPQSNLEQLDRQNFLTI